MVVTRNKWTATAYETKTTPLTKEIARERTSEKYIQPLTNTSGPKKELNEQDGPIQNDQLRRRNNMTTLRRQMRDPKSGTKWQTKHKVDHSIEQPIWTWTGKSN